MGARSGILTFSGLLDELVAAAVRADVPAEVARRARRATARALSLPLAAPATVPVRRRAEAYFSAVVRRATVRGVAGQRAAARLVAAAVVADLREAGRESADIWHELSRGWAERIPGDVMEEYRVALCG